MNTKVVKHETLAAETTPQIHQSVPFRLIFAGSKSAPGKHQQRHRRRQPICAANLQRRRRDQIKALRWAERNPPPFKLAPF
jgi:hypothetical protein